MKQFPTIPGRLLAILALTSLLICGCSSSKPSDSDSVKYANRGNPGAKLDVKSVLVPDQMNLVYFYADW